MSRYRTVVPHDRHGSWLALSASSSVDSIVRHAPYWMFGVGRNRRAFFLFAELGKVRRSSFPGSYLSPSSQVICRFEKNANVGYGVIDCFTNYVIDCFTNTIIDFFTNCCVRYCASSYATCTKDNGAINDPSAQAHLTGPKWLTDSAACAVPWAAARHRPELQAAWRTAHAR